MEKEKSINIRDSGGQEDKYCLCDLYSYCIDANYQKSASFEQFLKKHRRQLIIERIKK